MVPKYDSLFGFYRVTINSRKQTSICGPLQKCQAILGPVTNINVCFKVHFDKFKSVVYYSIFMLIRFIVGKIWRNSWNLKNSRICILKNTFFKNLNQFQKLKNWNFKPKMVVQFAEVEAFVKGL